MLRGWVAEGVRSLRYFFLCHGSFVFPHGHALFFFLARYCAWLGDHGLLKLATSDECSNNNEISRTKDLVLTTHNHITSRPFLSRRDPPKHPRKPHLVHILPLRMQDHVIDHGHHVLGREPHRVQRAPLQQPDPHQGVDLRVHVAPIHTTTPVRSCWSSPLHRRNRHVICVVHSVRRTAGARRG